MRTLTAFFLDPQGNVLDIRDAGNFPRTFQWEVSVDRASWSRVVAETDFEPSTDLNRFPIGTTNCRYARLIVPQTTEASLVNYKNLIINPENDFGLPDAGFFVGLGDIIFTIPEVRADLRIREIVKAGQGQPGLFVVAEKTIVNQNHV